MLRDVVGGLVWAGPGFGYFMLALFLGLPEVRLEGEAAGMLLSLGAALAVIVFLYVVVEARDGRRFSALPAKMDEQSQRAREGALEQALRLNAHVVPPGCYEIPTGNGPSGLTADIIPFPTVSHMQHRQSHLCATSA